MTSGTQAGHFRGALLAVCISTVLTLLAIEILFRAFVSSPKPPSKKDRPLAYFMPSNAPSLQDAEIPTKTPGTFRIIVLGDSFTFGPYLQFTDTFPKKLEKLLNLNSGTNKIEVINRGLPGASTFSESIKARNLMALKPDLLLLEITLNDAEPRLLTKQEKSELYDAPYLDSGIFKIWTSLGYFLKRIHNSQTVNNYIDYHTKFFKDPQTLGVFNQSLEKMKELSDNAKIPLVAVVFPLFDFPIDKNYPLKQSHRIISKSLKTLGITEIPLRKSFSGIPQQRLQVIPGDDTHPNEIAHRIAAESILIFLAHHNLIPKENIPLRVYGQRQHYQQFSEKDPHHWDRMYETLFGKRKSSKVLRTQAPVQN